MFETFFTIIYVLTGAINDPGLRVPRFTVWGWGQKQIFEKGGKVFFALQKRLGKLAFLQTCLWERAILCKFREVWETSYLEKRFKFLLDHTFL